MTIKTYKYKAPVANLIYSILMVCFSFVFPIFVFFGRKEFPLVMNIFLVFLFLFIISVGILAGYTSFKNIKPQKIVLKEDRITIPDLSPNSKTLPKIQRLSIKIPASAKNRTFYYSKINELEIRSVYGHDFSVVSMWLSRDAIYVADATHFVFIHRAWMKNKKEFNELFEFLKEKTAC